MDEDKTGWIAIIATVGALSLCCGLPLLVTLFGVGAVVAFTEYGLAGLLIAGVLGGVIYLRLRSRRRQGCNVCETAIPPHIEEPAPTHHQKGP